MLVSLVDSPKQLLNNTVKKILAELVINPSPRSTCTCNLL